MKTQTNLSEDEIIRDWSLTTDDKRFVGKFKTQYRLWIYLQVCALRMFGQLLENPNALDSRIVGHACNTMNLPILGTVEIPSRNATRTECKKQIFDHLSFTRFDKSKSLFNEWLKQKVSMGTIISDQLVPDTETFLVSQKIALPTLYYLKREISSACSQQQEIIFNGV